jgi:hypothetical protein
MRLKSLVTRENYGFSSVREPAQRADPNHNEKAGGATCSCIDKLLPGAPSLQINSKGIQTDHAMKKLLLLPLVIMGLALVPVKHTEAQVSVGVGFGYPAYQYSYYGYHGYNGYYPYSYYRGYPYYRTYYYTGPRYNTGHRVYRHHKHPHH